MWVHEKGGGFVGTNKKTTIKFRIDESTKRDFLKLCKWKKVQWVMN